MTITRRTRTFAALAAASALALSACGGDDSSNGGSSSSTSSSDAASSSASEPSESASDPSSEATEGDDAAAEGTVTATKSGLNFEVPDGWETVDPSQLAQNSDDAPKALKDMAKSSGMSLDEFLQGMSQSIDVMALGESKDGFAQNVNVIANPSALTAADLKASLKQQKATVSKTEEVDTPEGKATVATYTLKVGSQTVEGQMAAVPSDSGAGVITVSTIDKDETAKIMDSILKSVKKS